MSRSHMLTGVLALAVGLFIGRMAFTPEVSDSRPAASQAAVASATQRPGAQLATGPQVVAGADARCSCQELAATRQRLDHADAACALRIHASGGVEPLRWPEAPLDAVSPDEVQRIIADAYAACPELEGRVIGTDCDEFPCAVYLTGGSTGLEECGSLMTPTNAVASVASSFQNGQAFAALFFIPHNDDLPEGYADDFQARKTIRFREALKTYGTEYARE